MIDKFCSVVCATAKFRHEGIKVFYLHGGKPVQRDASASVIVKGSQHPSYGIELTGVLWPSSCSRWRRYCS